MAMQIQSDWFKGPVGGGAGASPLPMGSGGTPVSGTQPGVVPPAGSTNPQWNQPTGNYQGIAGYSPTGNPFSTGIGGGQYAVSPLQPNFTGDFYQYLQSLLGRGATPYNLQAQLPTGGTTGAGQLSAPLDPLMQQLMSYYMGGSSSMPGAASMSELATTGSPISSLPAWQSMTEAQQRQIDQNAARLKGQFAFTGNLASSPMSNAMTDYYTQTSKDQNALLGAMTQQAQEAAQGRRLGAGEFLQGQAGQMGQFLQGLDQASVDRLMQEFVRTRPEYNPLLNMMFAGATTFPPTFGGSHSSGTAGVIGSALQNIDWNKLFGNKSGASP
jgi:hypothetical protein